MPARQDIAMLKARTAASLHRPTKALEDGLAGGRVALPEFFHDWRFLFVGLRWWVAKIRGRA